MSEALLMRVRRVADELDARVAGASGGAGRSGRIRRRRRAGQRAPATRCRSAASAPCARPAAPGFTAIGAGVCDGADLELLARHGASLIACPQAICASAHAHRSWRSRATAPASHRQPAASGALDVLAEARSAALHSGLGAGEALRMATLGGATVLDCRQQIGSIEPGKAADLVCIDLGALACQPAAASRTPSHLPRRAAR